MHLGLQHDGSAWTWALIGDEDESLAQGMRYERRSEVEHAIVLVRGAPGNGNRVPAGPPVWHNPVDPHVPPPRLRVRRH